MKQTDEGSIVNDRDRGRSDLARHIASEGDKIAAVQNPTGGDAAGNVRQRPRPRRR